MATEVGNLVANLQLQQAQFISEMRKVNSRLGRLESRFLRVGRIGSRAFKAIGVAVAAVGLARITRDTIAFTDDVGKLSDRLAISTEALSELGFVAERSGVSFRSFGTALQRQGRRVSEAARGSGEAVAALEELGLSAQRLSTIPLDQQFLLITDALNEVENELDRSRLAMKLWDTEGVSLLQVTNQTSEEILELANRFRRLGGTITQDAARAAATARDNMLELRVVMQSLARSVALNVIPRLTELVRFLIDRLPGAIQRGIALWNTFKATINEFVASTLTTLSRWLATLIEITGSFDFLDPLTGKLTAFGGRLEVLADQFRGVAAAARQAASDAQNAARVADRANIAPGAGLRRPDGSFGIGGRSARASIADASQQLIASGAFRGTGAIEEAVTDADLTGLQSNVARAIEGGARAGGQGLVSTLLQIVRENLVAQLAASIGSGIAGAFGGASGGGIGAAIGSLFGAQQGGLFKVAGGGGPDSKVVALRATPGETLAAVPPGRRMGGGGVTINQQLTVQGGSRADFIQGAQVLREQTKADMLDLLKRRGAIE